MSRKRRTVLFYRPITEPKEDFIAILKRASRKHSRRQEGFVQLRGLNDSSGFVLGILVYSRTEGTPPVHDFVEDKFEQINLETNEGLAYGNVILYDPHRNILAMEQNHFGVHISSLADIIKNEISSGKGFSKFDIFFEPILTPDAYDRIIKMRYHKKIAISIANPTSMILEDASANRSLLDLAGIGKEASASSMEIILKVEMRNSSSLNPTWITNIVRQLRGVMKISDEHVKKVNVSGKRESAQDDGELIKSEIDLLNDRLKGEFMLNEPKRLSNLQDRERKDGILEMYRDLMPSITTIIG